jgi:electron transfer flavoprotein alpha/beta subunit
LSVRKETLFLKSYRALAFIKKESKDYSLRLQTLKPDRPSCRRRRNKNKKQQQGWSISGFGWASITMILPRSPPTAYKNKQHQEETKELSKGRQQQANKAETLLTNFRQQKTGERAS